VNSARARTGWLWWAAVVAAGLGLVLPTGAINSPRPSGVRLDAGQIVITWTNLSTAHGWLLSYRDGPGSPWLWETQRLEGATLTLRRPATEPVRFYRLWPAP